MAVRSIFSPKKIIRSRHSALIERMNRSMWGVRFGERGGRADAWTGDELLQPRCPANW
jgi:hypothetical protein